MRLAAQATRSQWTTNCLRRLQTPPSSSCCQTTPLPNRGHGRALSSTVASSSSSGWCTSSSTSALSSTASSPLSMALLSLPSTPRLSTSSAALTSWPMKSMKRSGFLTTRTMVMITQTSAKDSQQQQQQALENCQNDDMNLAATSTSTAKSNDQDLIITKSCTSRIKQLASTRPDPSLVYLRVFVDAGGCSGFQYKFLLLSEDGSHNSNNNNNNTNITTNLDEEDEDGTIDPEEDIIFHQDGVRIVIDTTSLELLRGSTIDYVQEMIKSSFAVVGNPQSESACGCGSSFAVKNFEANPALD